jgi:hypothetical protein
MSNPWDPVWMQRPPPKPKWEWDVVGQGLFVCKLTQDVSWFRRLRTRIFLGSRWKRL